MAAPGFTFIVRRHGENTKQYAEKCRHTYSRKSLTGWGHCNQPFKNKKMKENEDLKTGLSKSIQSKK